MNLLKDVLFASLWGLVLLILVGLIIASSIIVFDRSTSFHTSDIQQQYKRANAAIDDLLLEPELNINTSGYKMNDSTPPSYDVIEERAKKLERISRELNDTYLKTKETLYANCPDCNHRNLFSSFLYEPKELKERLEQFTNSNRINYTNRVIVFSFVMGLLAILFSLYLLIALLRYKKLTATGITILILLITPLLLTAVCFMVARVDDYMITMEFEFGLEQDDVFHLITFSVVYFFVIYPPIILVSKKRGYSIGKILKLNGFSSDNLSEEFI